MQHALYRRSMGADKYADEDVMIANTT